MKTVRYVAPINDSSGYAQAARNVVQAFILAGIPITITPMSFEVQHTSHGAQGKLIRDHINVKKDWDINIVHATPENWPRYYSPTTYNIGYTVWETTRLPAKWIPIINTFNEVWVPTQWNVEIFKNSGVAIPIKCLPHPIPIHDVTEKIIDTDKYKFYSIFQWVERKNPECLLRAYLSEFKPEEKVTLLLKTYHMGWTEKQQNFIKGEVKTIKDSLALPAYPTINFIGDLLTQDNIHQLHNTGDCFVLPTRGEGFGMPLAEAMTFGKPCITTGWGGALEFCNENNSYLLNSTLGSVKNMPWDKYTSDQSWANVEVDTLRTALRHVYEHQDEARLKGITGRKNIESGFSYEAIGQLLREYIEVI